MKNKGFTIIELVMVMVAIGILSVVTIVATTRAIRQIQLGSATDKMVSDLRYAKLMASGTAKWYGISVEVSPLNQYTIYTTTGTRDTVVDNPAKLGSNFVIKVNTDYGVSIYSVNIAGGKKVEFSPLGTPYDDRYGTALTADGVITLSKESISRTILISPNTGRIFIQ